MAIEPAECSQSERSDLRSQSPQPGPSGLQIDIESYNANCSQRNFAETTEYNQNIQHISYSLSSDDDENDIFEVGISLKRDCVRQDSSEAVAVPVGEISSGNFCSNDSDVSSHSYLMRDDNQISSSSSILTFDSKRNNSFQTVKTLQVIDDECSMVDSTVDHVPSNGSNSFSYFEQKYQMFENDLGGYCQSTNTLQFYPNEGTQPFLEEGNSVVSRSEYSNSNFELLNSSDDMPNLRGNDFGISTSGQVDERLKILRNVESFENSPQLSGGVSSTREPLRMLNNSQPCVNDEEPEHIPPANENNLDANPHSSAQEHFEINIGLAFCGLPPSLANNVPSLNLSKSIPSQGSVSSLSVEHHANSSNGLIESSSVVIGNSSPGQSYANYLNIEIEGHSLPAEETLSNTSDNREHVKVGTDFFCFVCRLYFSSVQLLQRHLNMQHNNKNSRKLSSKPFNMYVRLRRRFISLSRRLPLIEQLSEDGRKTCLTKLEKCHVCYKSFGSYELLKIHMSSLHVNHELKQQLCCHICQKRFMSKALLACHFKVHRDNMFSCSICLKGFRQLSLLKQHVNSHKKQNGFFDCPQCTKEFPKYLLLRRHVRYLHEPKRFLCQYCEKSFYTRNKLKLHLLVHSNIQDYSCELCQKKFKRKDKLKEHVKRIHENMQNIDVTQMSSSQSPGLVTTPANTGFVCQECGNYFKRRGIFVNHLIKRHAHVELNSVAALNSPILKALSRYHCPYCSKIYISFSRQKSHIAKCHPGLEVPALPARTPLCLFPVEPFKCPYCQRQYASNAKLLQHKRKHHLTVLPPHEKKVRLMKISK